MLGRELKKGTTSFLILASLEAGPRHGYELSKRIEARSDGLVQVHAASLYPLLYRLEQEGWIAGRWVERAGERRRRYYRLTAAGRQQLDEQRQEWLAFVHAIGRAAGVEYA